MPPFEAGQRSDAPFVEEFPRLLEERGLTMSAVAREAGVDASHLSKVLRHASYKTPSARLTEKVARALGLPAHYFPEYREATILARVRADPSLRDELFDALGARGTNGPASPSAP